MKTIVAIDPGKSGGIACQQNGKVWQIGFGTMTEGDIIEVFNSVLDAEEGPERPVAILEELVKFAGPCLPGSVMAVYGASYGLMKGALLALKFEVRIARAQKWQKELGLSRPKVPKEPFPKWATEVDQEEGKKAWAKKQRAKKVAADQEWKRSLRQRAQELFPGLGVTLQTADALLILEWGRKTV